MPKALDSSTRVVIHPESYNTKYTTCSEIIRPCVAGGATTFGPRRRPFEKVCSCNILRKYVCLYRFETVCFVTFRNTVFLQRFARRSPLNGPDSGQDSHNERGDAFSIHELCREIALQRSCSWYRAALVVRILPGPGILQTFSSRGYHSLLSHTAEFKRISRMTRKGIIQRPYGRQYRKDMGGSSTREC